MLALIVDDSRVARSALRRILAEVGFDVVEAAHGQEALDRLESASAFDVALVDWNMPEMDGLELVRTLRAQRRFADLPVMMVTAETDVSQVARALMVGADEYAMKPFDRDSIVEKLRFLGLLREA